ncbi:uncharacterized protein tcerg1b isoform X2 [Anguilla rostrata]
MDMEEEEPKVEPPKEIKEEPKEVELTEEERAAQKAKPVATNPIPGTPWCVVWTGDDRVFFYNPTTRLSMWDRPEELIGRADVDKSIQEPPHKKGLEDGRKMDHAMAKSQKRMRPEEALQWMTSADPMESDGGSEVEVEINDDDWGPSSESESEPEPAPVAVTPPVRRRTTRKTAAGRGRAPETGREGTIWTEQRGDPRPGAVPAFCNVLTEKGGPMAKSHKRMRPEEALEWMTSVDPMESDGGSEVEVEINDDDWGPSSESEPEPAPVAVTPPVRRRTTRKTAAGRGRAPETGREGTIWTEQRGDPRPGAVPAFCNVLTEKGGPMAKSHKRMRPEEALEWMTSVDPMESDGGSEVEVEINDDDWGPSSESEPESEPEPAPVAVTPPVRRRTTRKTAAGQGRAPETGRDGTIWTEQRGDPRPGGVPAFCNVLTEKGGPMAKSHKRMRPEEALEWMTSVDPMESDGGSEVEVEINDDDWGPSSESESEPEPAPVAVTPPVRRRTTRKTAAGRGRAPETGRDGTVWTEQRGDPRPGAVPAFCNVLTEKGGPMAKSHKRMRPEEALEWMTSVDPMESDGGSEVEVEINDDDWGPSPESEPESEPEPAPVAVKPTVGRRTTRKTAAGRERARDGTVWTEQKGDVRPGGLPAFCNVLTEKGGPTRHAKAKIASRLDSFMCLFDLSMLMHIRDCTVTEANRVPGREAWCLSIDELKAFIAILYVRGVTCGRNADMESFWSDRFGHSFFKDTMPRNRFREIMRFLRFDCREERLARQPTDRFALVSQIWDGFVRNAALSYRPGRNITVGTQLFPTKSRCPFTQYMAKKPDKFGIKFWLAADVAAKYMLNGFPHLGKHACRPEGRPLSEHVVMTLVEPFVGEGRTVTVDGYFTSLSLANRLMAKKTGLLGPVGRKRRGMPSCALKITPAPLYSTSVMTSGHATLTVYQSTRSKNVCLLSTMRPTVSVGRDPKRKPETVTDYNHTKAGVDALDQKARLYTTKAATRRWPVAVFYNVLDLAAVNAHVLFGRCLDKAESRRDFILELACELREKHMRSKALAAAVKREAAVAALIRTPIVSPRTPVAPPRTPMGPGKRTHCQVARCARNKASDFCVQCSRYVCGPCSYKLPKLCVLCVSNEHEEMDCSSANASDSK